MPVFFQQQINESTRLGVWKIEETEEFFRYNVPQHRDVTHPHKRLQHLAGRFLLQFLFPDFPYELVQIADTRKPFLPGEQYHFSISHCGDYAAAIVSRESRVGIDVELVRPLVGQLMSKFLSQEEKNMLYRQTILEQSTMLWCAKESVFKWYGEGSVDFRQHIQIKKINEADQSIDCFFSKTGSDLTIRYQKFDQLYLAWVKS
jgi:phosphopantetheinyl transferase